MSEQANARQALQPVRLDHLIGRGDPGRPAVTYKDRTLTYAELSDRVARVARGLHDLGVRRGDRVVVFAEKRIETVVAILAVTAAGAAVVPVNPQFKARQLGYVAADCAARVVVTTVERLDVVREALPDGTGTARVVVMGGARADGHFPWDELEGGDANPVPDGASVIDDDVAAILYTSGSTGGPKGVVLSHRNMLAGAASVAGYLRHTPDDVVLAALPLSFDAGLSQLTTTLIAGAHLVLVNYLLPREIVRLCQQHRVTGLTCVPPLWLQLAGLDWPAEASAHLRYFANTGGRLPRATLDRLREVFGSAEPFLMYGLTEAFRSTYLDPAEAGRHPDSIGKAVPNAEVLVVRPDGSACDPGEHGELVHRGALVALGYWNDPERTALRFRPAPGSGDSVRPEIAVWSGDIAYRDEEGFLYFVGRADDLIKSSGYRISPTEVEEAAYATGMVDAAVALGVADERLGQRIVLVVSTDGDEPDPELLIKTLTRDLPKYMVPHRVEVLTELPRSVNGKFDRVALRRMVER